jgi:hypothetical protein
MGQSILPKKPAQLLAHISRRRRVEPPYAPVDTVRFNTSDLCRADDGRSGQSRTREIGNWNIARPRLIVSTGDHGDPDEPVARELAVGNHQRGRRFSASRSA